MACSIMRSDAAVASGSAGASVPTWTCCGARPQMCSIIHSSAPASGDFL